MSIGGSFFSNKLHGEHEEELETLAIKNALENHLFDTFQLLSIYVELSDLNKRELFRKVIVAFIEYKINENNE